MKRYRFGFEPWGLALFALIMLPNIVWMLVAGENDLLMQPSVTPRLDVVVSISQILTVTGMICLRRCERLPFKPLWPLALVAAYLLMWALYGLGVNHALVLLGLAVLPCAAILVFLAGRKNRIALIPAAVFAAGHVLSSFINFVR